MKLVVISSIIFLIVSAGITVAIIRYIGTLSGSTIDTQTNEPTESRNDDKGTARKPNQSEKKADETKPPEANNPAPRTSTPSNGSAPSSPQESNGGGGTVQPSPSQGGPKKNCIANPSACGYPDSTNTGYKHTGVTLTTEGITINQDGDFIISQDNTVIDSKRIDGCVIVRAKNVTIRRSLITNCQAYYNIWMQELPGGGIRDTSNFVMEDVEVDGNNVFTNAAIVDDNGKGMTIRRMDMHNVADGPHPGENWVIEDSFIHDMYVCPNDCHTDSIQSAGAINVVIRHNTILNNPDNNGTGGKNAVIRIATEQGPVNGFVVDNNLLDGGNYAVQVRSQGNGAPQGVIVTNNRIVPTWRFAPYDFTGIPVVLGGNFRDDTLEALNTPM